MLSLPAIEVERRIAHTLTRFATTSRYPDFDTMLVEEDANFAIKYAGKILGMVAQILQEDNV